MVTKKKAVLVTKKRVILDQRAAGPSWLPQKRSVLVNKKEGTVWGWNIHTIYKMHTSEQVVHDRYSYAYISLSTYIYKMFAYLLACLLTCLLIACDCACDCPRRIAAPRLQSKAPPGTQAPGTPPGDRKSCPTKVPIAHIAHIA